MGAVPFLGISRNKVEEQKNHKHTETRYEYEGTMASAFGFLALV
jgi:hypothetical protein